MTDKKNKNKNYSDKDIQNILNPEYIKNLLEDGKFPPKTISNIMNELLNTIKVPLPKFTAPTYDDIYDELKKIINESIHHENLSILFNDYVENFYKTLHQVDNKKDMVENFYFKGKMLIDYYLDLKSKNFKDADKLVRQVFYIPIRKCEYKKTNTMPEQPKTITFPPYNDKKYSIIDNHLPLEKITIGIKGIYQIRYIFIYGDHYIFTKMDRLSTDYNYKLFSKEELQKELLEFVGVR